MQQEFSDQVGKELLFENDRVRVWDMQLAPGEASPKHRHTSDYVFVYVTPSRLVAEIEGETPTPTEFDDGFVQYTEVGPGIRHRIVNVGERAHRQIIIELKGGSRSNVPRPGETNRRSRRP